MQAKNTNGPQARAECKNESRQLDGSNSFNQSQRLRHRNEVHVAGVLARDPEIRYTPSGKAVCSFTVASTYQKYTEYVRCVAWEKLAEKLKEFHKGDFVELVGRMQTRSWDDKQTNQKRYVTEVIAWALSDGTTEKNAHNVEVSDADIPF